MPKSELASRRLQHYHERYQWPLGVAIVALMVEMFVPERRRKAPRDQTAISSPEQNVAPRASLVLHPHEREAGN